MGTQSARCAVTTAVAAVRQPRAGSRSSVHPAHLRRGSLDMNARCAGVAAAAAAAAAAAGTPYSDRGLCAPSHTPPVIIIFTTVSAAAGISPFPKASAGARRYCYKRYWGLWSAPPGPWRSGARGLRRDAPAPIVATAGIVGVLRYERSSML